MVRSRVWLSLLMGVPLLLAACRSGAGLGTGVVPDASPTGLAAPARSTVRDNGAGGVTVEATWLGLQDDGGLAFKLALNTHSVDLSRFDVAANVVLRDETGRELPANDWRDERSESHHRSGTVRFPPLPPGSEGNRITLVVRNLAGVAERTLTFGFQQ